jgi:hypothetical protein
MKGLPRRLTSLVQTRPALASGGLSGLPPASRILSVRQVAKVHHKSPMWVRRQIAAGAPCVELGSVGRGRGSRIDLAAFQRWLANRAAPGLTVAAHTIQLDELSESLWRVLRNDTAAETVGITERQAAKFLLLIFDRLAKDLTREPVDLADLPARMKQFCAISTE